MTTVKNHHFKTAHAIQAYSATRHLWDTPLFESDSFVAVPTVGSLVEGWLLVVPKDPLLAFAHLPEFKFGELEQFLTEVAQKIQSHYGPVSMFEHGPSATGSAIGCGVDYAHLHLVPTTFDLQVGAQQLAPEIKWREVDSLKEIRNYADSANGYWLLQQPFETGRVMLAECGVRQNSQLFRKVIAHQVGCPRDFDWKVTSGEKLILATVETLSGHLALI